MLEHLVSHLTRRRQGVLLLTEPVNGTNGTLDDCQKGIRDPVLWIESAQKLLT